METTKTESLAVTTIARCVQTFAAWVFLVTFVFDGEPFDYVYEVGPLSLTEPDAKAVADRSQFMRRAQGAFLRDVHLDKELPH